MSPEQDSPGEKRAGKLKVCLVAENASFRFGGEASLPLHYFTRLRERGVEAWLVVHGRNQQELRELFPEDQERIAYIPDRWYHKLIWRCSTKLPRRVAEATLGTLLTLINQVIQKRMTAELIRRHGIDVVHQPYPVSPKAPSFMTGLGVPVVIGPMNGGMDYPPAFRGAESLLTRVTVAVGRASANLINRVIAGKKHAELLLVANPRTAQALPSCVRGEVIELVENGVNLSVWRMPEDAPGNAGADERTGFARFVFVGRLVDWKRLDFVLRALAAIPEARLEVIGNGGMRTAWEALARELGVDDRVEWLGWRAQPECAEILRGATALLLPSIYECGGAVVLEAMACGIPAIATAWGGPADYLDASCGILVDASNEKTILEEFTEGMRRLAGDAELCARMGAAG
ncbi:MAG TPA: glycosyltransferase family 4 protein, partial [Acidobacteriaceae bacterium]